MENTVKKTKAMNFMELREIVLNTVTDEEKQNELLEFIDKQMEALDKRKVAAANRAAQKKEESDALTEEIFALIGNELVTIDEIVVALDNEEITRNKVSARLGKLVKNGRIVKDLVKVEGNKRMAYRLPVEGESVETEE